MARDNSRFLRVVEALLGKSTYQEPYGYGSDLDDENVKRTREALGGQIQPLPTTRLRWYLVDLELAQHQADAGNLRMAAQLYRAMQRDGALSGLLSARTAGLMRMPRKFYGDPEICDSLKSTNGSRPVFDEMIPPAEGAALLRDGVSIGVGVAELVPVAGREFPVLVRLDPEFLQYRWNENRWYYASIAGLLPVTPGLGRWVLHVPGARMQPWTFGLWPTLGRSFINKEHALLHRSNYSAKLANPARVAYAPLGATERERIGFFKRLMAWGINAVFEMPPGWDAKLLESNGRGIDVFQAEIDTCDAEYRLAITGQHVTTTGGSGFANAEFPNQIREDLIAQDAESFAYTINTQVLPCYIAANFGGPGAIIARNTNVQWITGKPKELADESKTLLQTAQAIQQLLLALQSAGRELDINALCERYGVPLVDTSRGEQTGVPAMTPKNALDKRLPPSEPTPEARQLAEKYAA